MNPWTPTPEIIAKANITAFMQKLRLYDRKSFHRWTVDHYEEFWRRVVATLGIVFDQASEQICDLSHGVSSPSWFPGALLNITNSCFTAPPTMPALVYWDEQQIIRNMSYHELNQLSNQVANSLVAQGLNAGDAIGIAMPMNQYAIAIYLGIIKMGGVVVSIADSFSSEEIATRLNITAAKAIFTQATTAWMGKTLQLYEKVKQANPQQIFVISDSATEKVALRERDLLWKDFLVPNTDFTAMPCTPMSPCNILFSSGTTGTPKAIIWNHTTPIKTASDAYFHHNIQAGDVLAWPTNLGWMMGPWLIYAALINHATIALYTDAPKERKFGEFIQAARVTMLGVVPTLVAIWRQSRCMEKLDWSTIKVFSSSGECSNPDDMSYLMSLAGHKPIIEYCGGTEIGGAYISSTVIENNYPALFTTATMGLDFCIIDETGKPSDRGEVALVPPSIGLSTQLLNADHEQVYFAGMPSTPDGKRLRRHSDEIIRLDNDCYSILGRTDDTMNLGGIKISAAEIERALTGLAQIIEVAAIAIPPADNGPSMLVIYAATTAALDKIDVLSKMQKKINAHLNPLFKIHDVIFVNELPKTASNKIMRRVLREKYLQNH